MRYLISEVLETVNTAVLDRIPDQEDPCNAGNSAIFILFMAYTPAQWMEDSTLLP